MFRPIPAKILRTTVTVKVCTGTDRYQNQTYQEYTVNHVHLQPTNEIIKSTDNTDCQLRSVLFADRRHSVPGIDWMALFNSAHTKCGDMRVIAGGVEYTVMAVDKLMDDTDQLHHWEISLM